MKSRVHLNQNFVDFHSRPSRSYVKDELTSLTIVGPVVESLLLSIIYQGRIPIEIQVQNGKAEDGIVRV
jgi:hypothetical protein